MPPAQSRPGQARALDQNGTCGPFSPNADTLSTESNRPGRNPGRLAGHKPRRTRRRHASGGPALSLPAAAGGRAITPWVPLALGRLERACGRWIRDSHLGSRGRCHLPRETTAQEGRERPDPVFMEPPRPSWTSSLPVLRAWKEKGLLCPLTRCFFLVFLGSSAEHHPKQHTRPSGASGAPTSDGSAPK